MATMMVTVKEADNKETKYFVGGIDSKVVAHSAGQPSKGVRKFDIPLRHFADALTNDAYEQFPNAVQVDVLVVTDHSEK